jgi:hypothetical protein
MLYEWGDEKLFKILIEKLEEKRQIGRPRCRWEDNIKTDHKERVGKDMVCIQVDEDRDRQCVLVVMNRSGFMKG